MFNYRPVIYFLLGLHLLGHLITSGQAQTLLLIRQDSNNRISQEKLVDNQIKHVTSIWGHQTSQKQSQFTQNKTITIPFLADYDPNHSPRIGNNSYNRRRVKRNIAAIKQLKKNDFYKNVKKLKYRFKKLKRNSNQAKSRKTLRAPSYSASLSSLGDKDMEKYEEFLKNHRPL